MVDDVGQHEDPRLRGRPAAIRASGGVQRVDGQRSDCELRWSKAWLQTAGPNVLRCEFSTDSAGLFTEFEVVQEAPERHPVLRPHHVTVGLYKRSGDSLMLAGGAEVDVA